MASGWCRATRMGRFGIWGTEQGTLQATLQAHRGAVRSVVFSPGGTMLASGSDNRTVRLWSMEEGELLHTLQLGTNTVHSVAFSPDGTMLASGFGGGLVQLWNVERGLPSAAFGGYNGGTQLLRSARMVKPGLGLR